MTAEELARWIVEHGADKPRKQPEAGVPLYLPVPPPPPPPSKKDSVEVDYSIDFAEAISYIL